MAVMSSPSLVSETLAKKSVSGVAMRAGRVVRMMVR